MKFKVIILLLFMFTWLEANVAERASLSGFVYDEANGEALIGANIYLQTTTIGGSTNLSGYYVIPDVPVGDHIVICEYMGAT